MIKFSNKLYDVLKKAAQVWIPAASTLYFALAAIWGLADVSQVIGTLGAVDTFLGVVLAISSASYSPGSDGSLVIDKSHPSKDVYRIELSTPIDALDGKSAVTLAVVPKT